jgi:uncharacterized LabA/DUF88 family protein
MKTVVYIDGQNFLYKASEVLINAGLIADKQDLHKLDIRGIITHIVSSEELEIKYYGAKVKVISHRGTEIAEKSRRFSDNSRRLRNTLNQQSIKYVESGKLKLRDSDQCKNCRHQDLRFQEKGVDVGIAVDMIVDASSGDVDQAVLLSSDTDLIPAIKVVRSQISKVTYLGFSDKLTNAIISQVTRTDTIRDSEIIDAFNRLNPTPLLVLDGSTGSQSTQEPKE